MYWPLTLANAFEYAVFTFLLVFLTVLAAFFVVVTTSLTANRVCRAASSNSRYFSTLIDTLGK